MGNKQNQPNREEKFCNLVTIRQPPYLMNKPTGSQAILAQTPILVKAKYY